MRRCDPPSLATRGRSFRRVVSWAIATLAFVASSAAAADGEYDSSWGQGGRRLLGLSNGAALVSADAFMRHRPFISANGTITLAGTCRVSTTTKPCALRILADAAVDPGFGTDDTGTVVLAGVPNSALMFASVMMADGTVVLGGRDAPGGAARLARLTPQGLPDEAVSADGSKEFRFLRADGQPATFSLITAMQVLPDGHLLVAGSASNAAGDLDFAVARLDADLVPDPTFGVLGSRLVAFDLSTSRVDIARAMAVDGNGAIVLAGQTDDVGVPVHRALVARLDADGTLDPTFSDDGLADFSHAGADAFFSAVAIDRQNRPVLVGSLDDLGTLDTWVIRMTAGGQHDTSFGDNGQRILPFNLGGDSRDEATDIVILPDHRMLVAGIARYTGPSYRLTVSRLLGDGATDASFAAVGHFIGTFQPPPVEAVNDTLPGLAVVGDGLFVAGRGVDDGVPRFGLAKLTLDVLFADGFEQAPGQIGTR